MRFPVRVLFRCLSSLLIFFLLLPTFTSLAHAQTPIQSGQTQNSAAYQFASPNVDSDVPQNQHTFVQSLFLETLMAVQCQLTGIDFSNPTKSCLGLDMKTGKLGYAPVDPSQQGDIHFGGLLGVATQGISMMYTPTVGFRDYFQYLSDNFGIVKQTHAAAYTGFQGLQPVLGLWKTTRDVSYYLLIIAFIFIGIGVMLRLKIDPRTVMTIQNQIPRVIICIILITFSYAFAGLLIDTMWAVTYMGINKITDSGANPVVENDGGLKLSRDATVFILSNPYGYVNQIFASPGAQVGILDLGWQVSGALGTLTKDTLIQLIFGSTASTSCVTKTLGVPTDITVSGCLQDALRWVLGFLWFFIVAIAILITLFRIWLELIKAYIMIILYVILAPIWIVFGLLPKRPLGFEKWLRVFFANLAVFPAVVFILVGARVLHELFNSSVVLGTSTTMGGQSVLGTATQYRFVPPLVGNPDAAGFGSILEFAMILMAPQLLSIIREKLGAAPLKQAAAAFQTFTAARGAAGAPVKQTLKHWDKRDAQGNALGPLAALKDSAAGRTAKLFKWVPGVTRGHELKEADKSGYGGARAYLRDEQRYNDARKYVTDDSGRPLEVNGKRTKKTKEQLKEFDTKYGNKQKWLDQHGSHLAQIEGSRPPQFGGHRDLDEAQPGGAGQPGAGGATEAAGEPRPTEPAVVAPVVMPVAGGGKTPTAADMQPTDVIITIRTPDGHEMGIQTHQGLTVEQSITHHIENMTADEKQSPVVQQITTYLNDNKDNLKDMGRQLTPQRATAIGNDFSQHISSTAAPQPTTEPEADA